MKSIKHSALLSGAVLSAAVLTLVGCSEGIVDSGENSSGGESVELEYATFLAESHPYSQWYLAWAEEVTERTDGRITFRNYWSNTVLESDDIAPGAADGRVDLAQTSTSYNPNLFPLSELLSVPFATPQIGAALEGLVDMYANDPQYFAEFDDNNLIPLQFQPAGTNVLGTTSPVNGLSDLAGLSVRSGSFFTNAVVAAGANAVSMPLGDVYQSMQTGLINAWMTPIENAIAFNLAEVTPYIQDTGMGGFGLVAIVINKDTFEGLSAEDQQVLLETSDAFNRTFIEGLLVSMDAEACVAVQEAGSTPVVWSDAAIAEARAELAQPLLDQYVSNTNDAGADGVSFAAAWETYQQQYSGAFGVYPGSVEPCLAASN